MGSHFMEDPEEHAAGTRGGYENGEDDEAAAFQFLGRPHTIHGKFGPVPMTLDPQRMEVIRSRERERVHVLALRTSSATQRRVAEPGVRGLVPSTVFEPTVLTASAPLKPSGLLSSAGPHLSDVRPQSPSAKASKRPTTGTASLHAALTTMPFRHVTKKDWARLNPSSKGKESDFHDQTNKDQQNEDMLVWLRWREIRQWKPQTTPSQQ